MVFTKNTAHQTRQRHLTWRLLATCTACFALFTISTARAGLPVTYVLNDSIPVESMIPHLGYYLTDNPAEALDQIQRLPPDAWTTCASFKDSYIGYTKQTVWVRMTLQAPTSHYQKIYLQLASPRIDYADFYICNKRNLVQHLPMGNYNPESASFLNGPCPTVSLSFPPGTTRTIFVRLHTETAIFLSFKVWQTDAYAALHTRSETQRAFLLGGMVLMLLIAFLFVWSTRERSALFYSLGFTCLVVGFAAFGGYFRYLPGIGAYWWSKWLINAPIIAGMAFLLQQTRCFFDLSKQSPKCGHILNAASIGTIIICFILPIIPYRYVIHIFFFTLLSDLMLSVIVVLIMSIRKARAATLFLLAHLVFWVYMIMQSAYFYGLVPFPLQPTYHGLIAILVSMIMFFIAMAVKVRGIRLAKEHLHAQALQAERALSSHLESKVNARTRSLTKAKERAEAANLAKTRFFAQISHDLRSPITWLIGLTDSLYLSSQELKLTTEFQNYLSFIRKGSYYLKQLLENIMDIDRLENAPATPNITTLDVQQWSESLHIIAQALAEAANINLSWSFTTETTSPLFTSDAVKLSQILMNLVHNAIKLTPAQQDVEVTIKHHAEKLCMDISDHGPGLPEDTKSIFDSFWRETSLPSQLSGTGLGLSIVKSHIDSLKGSITATNKNTNGGARFFITIPAAPSDQQPEVDTP